LVQIDVRGVPGRSRGVPGSISGLKPRKTVPIILIFTPFLPSLFRTGPYIVRGSPGGLPPPRIPPGWGLPNPPRQPGGSGGAGAHPGSQKQYFVFFAVKGRPRRSLSGGRSRPGGRLLGRSGLLWCSMFAGFRLTPGLLIYDFLTDRKSSIWGVWAALGGPETFQKGGGRSPPRVWKVSRLPGAAQTPKIDDCRSAKKSYTKIPFGHFGSKSNSGRSRIRARFSGAGFPVPVFRAGFPGPGPL